MVKNNPDPIPVLTIVGIVFAVAGLLMFFFPRFVHKYDMRMTRFIKDEEQYRVAVRVFGLVFLAVAVLVLSILVFLLLGK